MLAEQFTLNDSAGGVEAAEPPLLVAPLRVAVSNRARQQALLAQAETSLGEGRPGGRPADEARRRGRPPHQARGMLGFQ